MSEEIKIVFQFSLWDSKETIAILREYTSNSLSILFMRFKGYNLSYITVDFYAFNSLYEILRRMKNINPAMKALSILFMRFINCLLELMSGRGVYFQFSLWDSSYMLFTIYNLPFNFQFSLWDSNIWMRLTFRG